MTVLKTPSTPQRVQKRSSGSNDKVRRQAPVTSSWTHNLDRQINEYRQSIHTKVNTELREAEQAHIHSLNHLADDFERKLSVLVKAEQPLLQPLPGEVLRVIRDGKLENQPVQSDFEEVVLKDRMLAFKKTLDEEHHILRDLLHEWNNIQAALLTLTMKIFGPDILNITNQEIYDNLKLELSEASKEHDRLQAQRAAFGSNIASLQQRVVNLTTETRTTMEEQVKTCKLNRKKHLDRMNEALKWLQEDS